MMEGVYFIKMFTNLLVFSLLYLVLSAQIQLRAEPGHKAGWGGFDKKGLNLDPNRNNYNHKQGHNVGDYSKSMSTHQNMVKRRHRDINFMGTVFDTSFELENESPEVAELMNSIDTSMASLETRLYIAELMLNLCCKAEWCLEDTWNGICQWLQLDLLTCITAYEEKCVDESTQQFTN